MLFYRNWSHADKNTIIPNSDQLFLCLITNETENEKKTNCSLARIYLKVRPFSKLHDLRVFSLQMSVLGHKNFKK